MKDDELLNNHRPIDFYKPGPVYERLFKNLQGNILKDHGRDFANHIFMTFRPNAQTAVRKWINKQAKERITSTWQQREDSLAYKNTKGMNKNRPFVSLFLSASGYGYLDLDHKMPNEIHGNSFRSGMKVAGRALYDRPPENWDDRNWKRMRFPQAAIHAMILVANDDLVHLSSLSKAIQQELKPLARCFVERGRMMYHRGDTSKPVEHFGFLDGISNPIFLKRDLEEADGYEEDENGGKFSQWNPFAPLRLVLVRDPGGPARGFSFGSFLVFRKLEQNVKSFNRTIQRMTAELYPREFNSRQARENALGLVMGRFPNGTPIAVQPDEVAGGQFRNNFRYVDSGGRCPIKGHVRRTNSRGKDHGQGKEAVQEEFSRRIVRRGMTYGRRKKDLSDSPARGVGLLFMCYQRSISQQFEFMQHDWCNWEFARDPIVGQQQRNSTPHPAESLRNGEWPRQWADTQDSITSTLQDWHSKDPRAVLQGFQFGRHVILQGGEYFFAPSIPCLKNL